jgi:hypothetical protein
MVYSFRSLDFFSGKSVVAFFKGCYSQERSIAFPARRLLFTRSIIPISIHRIHSYHCNSLLNHQNALSTYSDC